MRTPWFRRRSVVVGFVALAMVAMFVGGAFANHLYSDVPTTAYYHDDVSWLNAHGVTAGCGGGKYCPDNAVTRGQMAVFLHNLADADLVGHASCPGPAWQPSDSTVGYTKTAGLFKLSSGGGFVRCELTSIPDFATITEVSWTVLDDDASLDVACELHRQRLTSPDIGFDQSLAFATTAAAAGSQVLQDTSISNAIVDNGNYGYWLVCGLTGDPDVGIYGGVVKYTHKGVPAP